MQSERVSEEELESFGQRKWESVLHFLVGMDPNSTNKTKPPKAIIKALRRINLLNDTGEGLKITSKGFQFLLRDPYSQVWYRGDNLEEGRQLPHGPNRPWKHCPVLEAASSLPR
mmetsp:Transcript_9047/g.39855  ORF Transcript_9047/g.39855 Transcript_9047/m.39855 type:complete len:114 (+) Transcript_9047:642-983(+)